MLSIELPEPRKPWSAFNSLIILRVLSIPPEVLIVRLNFVRRLSKALKI
jgi:hypothetical protein